MKITIKDFFAGMDDGYNTGIPSEERIKVLTMEKIKKSNKTKRSLSRIAGIAAVIAVICAISVAAYATITCYGYMNTEKMSQEELLEIMEVMERSGCYEVTDNKGNTHYYDSYGNEIMVLSPYEAKQYELEKMKAQADRCQAEAGDILDVDTLELMPQSITSVGTKDDGTIEDFLLTNGSMVLLHPNGAKGYKLNKGDVITLTVNATDACWLRFGVILEEECIEESAEKNQLHKFEYTVPKDGLYNFTLMYTSSDADNFTNCSITVQ